MLDRLPREPEWLSWLFVALWALVIFVTVPFARDLVDFLEDTWNLEVLTYAVSVVMIVTGAATLRSVVKRSHTTSLDYVFLIGITGLFVFLTFRVGAKKPAEALHYLEYGLLSILIYRALTHRIRDHSIFVAAVIIGTIVGTLDETIQWLTPRRFFTFEDIILNCTALVIVQAALATGVRPRLIKGWPDAASLRRVCRLGALAVTMLILCFLNTPDRVAWYTDKIPLLGFIQENKSIMVEYGYLYEDASVGAFRSRLTIKQLLHSGQTRAVQGAEILDQYQDRQQYKKFLKIYNSIDDPFLHEARVHLFRRDVYLERGDKAEDDEVRRENHTVAYWENLILEKYFGALLQASSYVWSTEVISRVKSNADTNAKYESYVSWHLITEFSQRHLIFILTGILIVLIFLGWYFGKQTEN
jgi:hypothetical protein